ncbi:MAG: hypothetical protein NVS4B7_08770 [Ktedonobacteraceae bacterium]
MSWRSCHLLRLLLLCLCSVLLLPMAFASKHAFAASDPITITSATDRVDFPKFIDFTMSARDSNSSITQAALYIVFKERPYAPSIPHQVTISSPAQTITLHYRADTSGDNFHSPGTPIDYYWILQDSAGNQHIEVTQHFTTLDTRYSWQHLSQGLLQVNWYNRSQNFGQLLLNKANTSVVHSSQLLGSGPLHPINLWVYASNEDFHGALAPGSYEWVGGEAHPWLNEAFISVVSADDDTLLRDMPHELTHLIFHQVTAQGPIAPTWFDEGMAVYNQLYQEPEMKFRFDEALTNHSLLRLSTISDGFPADADKAYLAYAQSWQLINYMYSTFGQTRMSLLIKNMNDADKDFGEDLTQSLGEDQLHLENSWRLYLHQPAILSAVETTPTSSSEARTGPVPGLPVDNTAPLFITLGSLLILLPLVGIVGIVVYQRRRQQQALAVQAAQHMLSSNAFPAQPNSTLRYPLPMNNAGLPQQPYQPYQLNQQSASAISRTFVQTPPEQAVGSSPTQAPGILWPPAYPTSSEEGSEYGAAPFMPFQESSNIRPLRQAPQE